MTFTDQGVQARRLWLRLGLLNGALVGLGLALGVWASDAILLVTTPIRAITFTFLLGIMALVILGGLAGWLAAWAVRGWAGALVWLIAGAFMMQVIGHLPYEGWSLIVWVSDRRAWGLPAYAFDEAAEAGMMLAGFFVLLVLGLLGLLQSYRLEGVSAETDDQGRLGGRGWFLLLLPLPLVAATGFVTDSMVNRPLRTSPQLVHEAIRTGRTYPGDLFALSQEAGVNYNAIAGVRELMSEDYILSVGSVDLGVNDTVFVVADFDNGAWIVCRVVAEQLSFCYDASQPYLKGLSALITAGQFPDDCPFCKFGIDDEQRAWLADRRDLFRGPPELERLAHWGSYVLVRAESSDGGYAVECLFEGMNPVRLDRCWEVQSRGQASDPSEEGSQNQAAVPLPSVAVTEKSLSGRTEAASEGRAPEPRLDSAMWDPSDRLGPPPMSDPPTQVELGHYAYYISCMVCHGDQGQGLEEWRTVLPEEDRDCWQSRCHAANHPPEGFQLPNYAPPLVGPGTLAGFSTAADLHGYMAARMPWQAPGFLPDEEYWQITSFLIKAHGAEPGDELLTPERAAAIPLP